MYLSGSVGYTLLKLRSDIHIKYILLLADVHDGVQYCEQDSIMIDKWLGMKDNNNVLLEEAVREHLNLTDLWPSSKHTQGLKILNRNNIKIRPIDIRPLLIPFSWELSEISNDLPKMTLKEYLTELTNLFNLKKTKALMTYIVPEMKKLQSNEIFQVSLKIHFNELKEIYNEFIVVHNKYMNTSILELYRYHIDVLEKINNIISMTMEWYALLLINNSMINTIIHLGLAHSNRLLDLLIYVYKFDIVAQSGINHMTDISNNPTACILVPSSVDDMFKKKYNKH